MSRTLHLGGTPEGGAEWTRQSSEEPDPGGDRVRPPSGRSPGSGPDLGGSTDERLCGSPASHGRRAHTGWGTHGREQGRVPIQMGGGGGGRGAGRRTRTWQLHGRQHGHSSPSPRQRWSQLPALTSLQLQDKRPHRQGSLAAHWRHTGLRLLTIGPVRQPLFIYKFRKTKLWLYLGDACLCGR